MASVTRREAQQAFYQRFEDEWGGATPIAKGNHTYRPTPGTPYVRIFAGEADSNQHTLGAPSQWRREWTGTISVYGQKGVGQGEALALADTAAKIFEGVHESGIQYTKSSVRPVGEIGDWYLVTVDVEFDFQERR